MAPPWSLLTAYMSGVIPDRSTASTCAPCWRRFSKTCRIVLCRFVSGP